LNTAEVYDPINNSWEILPSMSQTRGGPIVAAIGEKLYVVGGAQPGAFLTSSTEIFDPLTNSWTAGQSYPTVIRLGAAAVLGGQFYIAGGNTPNTLASTDAVYAFDPSLVEMPRITHQGEDFYISAQRGGPKTFVIPHPEHRGKMLRHACLEAPTRGTNIYEYQIAVDEDNGTTVIDLPCYFKYLNKRPMVYITPQSHLSRYNGYVNEELTKVIVETEKKGIFNILITGIRKDKTAVAYSSEDYIDTPI
jgi:hypothetical protein